MELAIQKATVFEPNNTRYRMIFFKLLKQLKKLGSAEREIGLIIQHSDKPSSVLFNERAQIRWIRKDYFGAIKDWKSAIQLAPRKASFYVRTAEAYIKLGDWRMAMEYYQKAVKIAPENRRYQKRYLELKGASS